MTRVRIRGGWLSVGPRKPGEPEYPDIGLPVEPGEPGDPDYPDNELPMPEPPPGIWPPPSKGAPIIPVPEGSNIPAGAIWPRPEGEVKGLFIVRAKIPDHGVHYIVVDPDAWPDPEDAAHPEHPIVPSPATRRS
jgi:hypothetical protein